MAFEYLVYRTLRHYITAIPPSTRAEVYKVVGGTHHLLVMLYHHHRIADIPKFLERFYQFHIISRVQANARLIEDVENVYKLGAYLGGQPDTLALSSREAVGSSAKR